jgi:hypothetical protein
VTGNLALALGELVNVKTASGWALADPFLDETKNRAAPSRPSEDPPSTSVDAGVAERARIVVARKRPWSPSAWARRAAHAA